MTARPSRVRTHLYIPNPDTPPPTLGGRHPCACSLPYSHPSHTLPEQDGPDAQQRAAGDRP